MRSGSEVKCGCLRPPVGPMRVSAPPSAGIQTNSESSPNPMKGSTASCTFRREERMATMRPPSGDQAGC